MRIVLISDTHGLHRTLEVPSGDLPIHAGDFTFYSKPPSIVSDFNGWLGSLPHRHKVVERGHRGHQDFMVVPLAARMTKAFLLRGLEGIG